MSGRVADWFEWSERQLAAILLLSFAMPVHESYLKKRLGVHGATLYSLIVAGLRASMMPEGATLFTLTCPVNGPTLPVSSSVTLTLIVYGSEDVPVGLSSR